MLKLADSVYQAMVATALDAWPLEACGLFAGPEAGDGPAEARVVYPTANAAASSRVYTVEPRDLLRADRQAEDAGLVIQGVWHSHTHTDAFPSPTDVASAPDPGWHYVLVSLRDTHPVVRSYRIVDGRIEEEQVARIEEEQTAQIEEEQTAGIEEEQTAQIEDEDVALEC